jgi:hypothetical protein
MAGPSVSRTRRCRSSADRAGRAGAIVSIACVLSMTVLHPPADLFDGG